MLTIVYVPPGKYGHMIDTFFHATTNGKDAMMGLADPELKVDIPCVGHVQSENAEGAISERAVRCLEYCKNERPTKFDEMVKTLGELANVHNIK
jgi:hypothetical protein